MSSVDGGVGSNRHLPGIRGDQTSKLAQSQARIVAHVDLDCFYVQVERTLNPELLGKPVAVVQYNPFGDLKSYAPSDIRYKESGSIIAVSYEARAKGVTRIMRGAEAKKKCPEIILVQVPTSHGKADLQIYRDASSRILKVLGERYPGIVIERASIDEVYLDVTTEASKWLQECDPHSFVSEAVKTLRAVPSLIAGDDSQETKMHKNQIRNGHAGTNFKVGEGISEATDTEIDVGDVLFQSESWFDRPAHMWSTEDRLLLSGSLVVRQLREDVFAKLGFTCSAGIAVNKMLSKLASGMHKPNKQTLVPLSVIPTLMKDLPFSRVQGFGGKLGHEIEARFGVDVKTMHDLAALGRVALTQAFGEETAGWIWNRTHGVDHDDVQDRALPISIGCSKSFRSTNMLLPGHVVDGTVLRWLSELAAELTERMKVDSETNSRRPKQLHVGLHVAVQKQTQLHQQAQHALTNEAVSIENRVSEWHAEQGISLSKIGRLPASGGSEAIAKSALSMLQRALSETTRIADIHIASSETQWGITSLGLSVTQFEGVLTGKQSIKAFLKNKTALPAASSSSALVTFNRELDRSNCEDDFSLLDVADSGPEYTEDTSLLSAPASPQKKAAKRPAASYSIENSNNVVLLDKDDDVLIPTAACSPCMAANKAPNPVLTLFHKYVRNVELDTFLSLPADIQQEVLNDAMFSQRSSTAVQSKAKKLKADPKSSSVFSKWLGK